MISKSQCKKRSELIYKLKSALILLSNERNAMSRYWGDVMSISNGVRWNMSKDFSYIGGFRGNHFEQHANLVMKGIEYRWLIYSYLNDECPAKDWENYKNKLIEKGVKSSVFGNQIQFKQLQLGKNPIPIPWRITIFENGLTLSSPERKRRQYGFDTTTIAFNREETEDLLEKFKRIWDNPSDDHAFNDFKSTYLNYFSKEYSKYVSIYKLERSLWLLRLTLLITAALIGISIIIQLLPHFH